MMSVLTQVCIFPSCVEVLEGLEWIPQYLSLYLMYLTKLPSVPLPGITVSCNATPANINALKSQIPILRKMKKKKSRLVVSDVSPV